jgi:hypothetical protein
MSWLHPIRENFTWTDESTRNFLKIQKTINPKKIFDTDTIQKYQASQEEVDYFNKHGYWKWSPKTKHLYLEALKKNSYIRTYSPSELKYVMSIYNEAAILKILSYQSKEGQFLLNGVQVKNPNGNKMEELPNGFGDFGYDSGLIGNLHNDIIKCTSSSNNSKLERIKYTGKGGIFGQQTKEISDVDYNDLENLIPGFSFLNGPCNPCGMLNEKADYSCKFRLNVKDKPLAY